MATVFLTITLFIGLVQGGISTIDFFVPEIKFNRVTRIMGDSDIFEKYFVW